MRRLLLASFLMMAAACGAGAPVEMMPTTPTDPGMTGGMTPSARTLDPPTMTIVPPAQSFFDKTAVQGKGPAGGTVLIESTAGGATTAPIGADGSFCVDVALKKNEVNVISVRVQDTESNMSDKLEFQTRQTGEPPAQQEGQTRNVAKMGDVVLGSGLHIESGTLVDPVDEDPNTILDLEEDLNGGAMRIKISFPQALEMVKTIKVSSPMDCTFKAYELYGSNKTAPAADPAVMADWTPIAITVDGDGEDVADLPAAIALTHIMIVPTEYSCEVGTFQRDHYKISEVQALTAPVAAGEIAKPQLCQ